MCVFVCLPVVCLSVSLHVRACVRVYVHANVCVWQYSEVVRTLAY